MHRLFVALAAIALLCGVAQAQTQTQTLPVTWDLPQQFADDASWNTALAEVRARLEAFARRRGENLTSAAQLAGLLSEAHFLRGRAGYMARFALLSSNMDTTSGTAKSHFAAATGLEAQVEGTVSWLDQSIGALPAARLAAWRRSTPSLQRYGWLLAGIAAQAGHRYPAGSEAASAQLERASFSASDVYAALMDSDLAWPALADGHGKTITLDPGAFGDLSISRDTDLRRRANQVYLTRLKALEAPLGVLLTRKLETDHALARARNFANGVDAFFTLGDGMPAGAARRMIDIARAHRALLQRYARVMGRLSGIAAPHYADLAAAAPPVSRTVSLDEAILLAIESAAPLGSVYQETLRQDLAKPWFDLPARPNKDAGALGVYWQIAGGHPYGIMNYRGSAGDARTVAAMAHGLMFYANMPSDKLPERREQDFPVYGNAVWFMGPLLQLDHVLAQTTDRAERVALIAGDLRRLWSNFFAGVAGTDFEDRVEAAVASDHPPTGAEITRLYRAVLEDYYGGGDIRIDDSDAEGWMTLDHAYYGHVVGEWAFAMAGAVAIADRVEQHDPAVIAAIVSPMRNPDSYLSYDLLRDVGADPMLPQSYDALFRRMSADMDLLDKEAP